MYKQKHKALFLHITKIKGI